MRVGRAKDCAIAVGPEDATVSAAHAVLTEANGAWTLKDAGSRTGTYLNGGKLQAGDSKTLRTGDWILFGVDGVLARVEGDQDRPMRGFLAVESDSAPGAFSAFADVAEATYGDFRFRLDRSPVVAEPIRGEGRTAVSAGVVVRRAPGVPGVKVLAVEPMQGAVSMGPESLQRIVQSEVRRRSSAMWPVVAVVAGLAVAGGYFVWQEMDRRAREASHLLDEQTKRDEEHRKKLADQKRRFDRELEEMREAWADAAAKQKAGFETELRRQKEAMEKEIAKRSVSERERFSKLLDTFRHSILLFYCEETFIAPGQSPAPIGASFGTGWVVSADGLVVTNKHVVQGWKFNGEIQAYLEMVPGARIETKIYAWPGGERFVDARGKVPNGATGHNDQGLRNLKVVAAAPDEWVTTEVELPGGTERVRTHALTKADLAVVKLSGGPFVPLPVKVDLAGVKELDPIMVLGFPLGAEILDAGMADVSASLGTIRWVRDDVDHTAPLFPGNSGGPLLSIDGEVIGVNSKGSARTGIETMGAAIRSDDLLRFLKTVKP